MPLFSRNPEPEEVVQPHDAPQTDEKPRHHGLFGLRRDPSLNSSATTSGTRQSAEAGSVTSSLTSGSGSRRSFQHRPFRNSTDAQLDPSIIEARERVMGAETAEREADRALDLARRQVREARDHVKRLELEAKEEARRAKIKQVHAREVSKRAKPLGRHDL